MLAVSRVNITAVLWSEIYLGESDGADQNKRVQLKANAGALQKTLITSISRRFLMKSCLSSSIELKTCTNVMLKNIF